MSRIRESLRLHGDALLGKVFSEGEQKVCLARTDPAPCFAARFAAKEATSKALGVGIGSEFGWLDMEVHREKSGQPLACFSEHGSLALHARQASSALISLSHLNEIASAVVVLVR